MPLSHACWLPQCYCSSLYVRLKLSAVGSEARHRGPRGIHIRTAHLSSNPPVWPRSSVCTDPMSSSNQHSLPHTSSASLEGACGVRHQCQRPRIAIRPPGPAACHNSVGTVCSVHVCLSLPLCRHTAAGKALFALYDKDFNGRSIGDRYHTQNKLRHQKLLEHGWTPPPKGAGRAVSPFEPSSGAQTPRTKRSASLTAMRLPPPQPCSFIWPCISAEVPKPVVERPQINYPKFGRDKHPKARTICTLSASIEFQG